MQVITGIGFIGAGTIIVTRQRRVKPHHRRRNVDLGIIGLACGAGYVGVRRVRNVLLVLVAELLLIKLERRVRGSKINVYVEYTDAAALRASCAACGSEAWDHKS